MSGDELPPHRKGDLTEAAVLAALKRRAIPVALPFGDNERYDLLAETPAGSILRMQVKTGRLEDGTVRFDGVSTHTNATGSVRKRYDGDVAFFLVYSHDLDTLYLIPEDEVGASMKLRVEPPEQADSKINFAESYRFDERWPPDERDDRAVGSSTTDRDSLSNAVEEAVEAFRDLRVPVFRPVGTDRPYDFLAETPHGRFVRVTLLPATLRDEQLSVETDEIPAAVRESSDCYTAYDRDTETTYLFPADGFGAPIDRALDPGDDGSEATYSPDDHELREAWPPRPVRSTPRSTGIAAAVDAFQRAGVAVAHPTDDTSYDLLAEANDSFLRVSVVNRSTQRGRLRLKRSVGSGIDCYVVHHKGTGRCYAVDADAFDHSISLRVEEPEKPDSDITWAGEFRIENNWPP